MPAVTTPSFQLPLLLAPAGDRECARAAVENGADAVYFGVEVLNARLRAQNFREDELPDLLALLHRRGVQGFLTLNTLVFAEELAAAERLVRRAVEAGVDALIVQDLGLCRLVRRLSPDVPLHASTQMTVTSAAGARLAARLGCSMVTLARELSLEELASLAAALGPAGPRLEVFVHGALCVSYSGRCLASLGFGGRSANRGACAQPCRLPYELLEDGARAPSAAGYLLSPRDLFALPLVPELVRLGVAALKIEGRLKSPEYVAATTRAYREALDRCASGQPPILEPPPSLQLTFSRGLGQGWLRGPANRELVDATRGVRRGVLAGHVRAVVGRRLRASLDAPLAPGDGVLVIGADAAEGQGGRLRLVETRGRETRGGETRGGEARGGEARGAEPRSAEVRGAEVRGAEVRGGEVRGGEARGAEARGAEALLAFGPEVDLARVQVGDELWKTGDPALERELRATYEAAAPRFTRPLSLTVRGRPGELLEVDAADELGHRVAVRSQLPLVVAGRRPLDQATLRAQLGRLGGTPFHLGSLTAELGGASLLPVSELNRLRRELVAALEAQRAAPPRWTLEAAPAVEPTLAVAEPPLAVAEPPLAVAEAPLATKALPDRVELSVLIRAPEQVGAVLAARVERVYLDLASRGALRAALASARQAGAQVWIAPPRVTRPGEEARLEELRALEPDGFLVRDAAQLEAFAGARLCGDLTWNAASPLAVRALLELGLERVTASLDLAPPQLAALLGAAPPGSIEVVLHGHEPLFHSELCLYCAHLGAGSGPRDCGRPCRTRPLRLRDRKGAEHPVLVDAGCRATVFHARARDLSAELPALAAAGARALRVELVRESAAQVRRLLARLRRALDAAGRAQGR